MTQQIEHPIQQMMVGTPSSPPAGSLKLYPKSDGEYYKLNSAGVETLVAQNYVLPDPLIVNNLTVRQVLSLGYANARLWDAQQDDPFGGGRLVAINALTVTPGALHTARLQVNGPAVVAGTLSSHSHTLPDGHPVMWGDGLSQIHSSGRVTYFDEYYHWYWRSSSQGYPARMVLDVNANLTFYGAGYAAGGLTAPGGVDARPGQLLCTHINTSADLQGGRPVYIAGQLGDNYLRWWNANAVLPPGGVVALAVYNYITTTGGNWVAGGTLYVDRPGQWVFFFNGRYDTPSDPSPIQYRLLINGGQVDYHQDDAIVPGGANARQWWGAALIWQGHLWAGNWGRVDFLSDGYGGQVLSGHLHAYFIPTQAYPS